MNKSSKALFVLFLSLVLLSSALAQRQTGSVAGVVTDEDGNPLPGATITLSGPAMMGIQTFTSTKGGDFRFPAVPPGKDYVITVELTGFQTVKREGIIVHVGKTVTINVQLKLATVKEEVTVVAPSPVVDVKSSKLSISYTEDLLNNIPLARDFYDVIKTAPGVISDLGNPAHRTFVANGSTERSNQVSLDGINVTDPLVLTNRVGFSFDAFEEFEFELGAHPAEVGMTSGAYVNIVTKSGGNEFHGQATVYFFNKHMLNSLIPETEAEAVGLSKPTGIKKYGDYSFSLGGPIIKDRLWFFVNGRFIDWKKEHETQPNGLFDLTHDEINTFAKITFKPFSRLKFTGMLSFGNIDEPILASMPPLFYWDKNAWVSVDNQRDITLSGIINWIPDQSTFFDLRINYLANYWPWRVVPDADPTLPTYLDLYTGLATGSVFLGNQDADVFRFQIVASGTRFLDNFLGGDHEIKAGIEYENSDSYSENYKQTPFSIFLTWKGLPWAFHEIVMPFMGMFYASNYGAKKGDTVAHTQLRRFSVYLQDSLTIKRRLTLNLGLRYDESHSDLIGGTHKPVGANYPVLTMLAPNVFKETSIQDMKNVMVWKDFSPRIGAVFDIFGDGKTALKASWSRYNDYLGLIYSHAHHPFMLDDFSALWLDLNANGVIETSDFYIPVYFPIDPSDFKPEDVIDPDVKSAHTNEFIVGLERELFKDFSISVSYIYKRKTNIPQVIEKYRGYKEDSGWWVPYTITDPGWDGQFDTSDDKQITVYGLKAGAPESRGYLTHIEEPERKYQGVEFTITKRMSNRWQLLGSITLSKYEGNIEADYGGSMAESLDEFSTPNYLINRYGRLNYDRPVLIKLQGSVVLPYDFILSAFYMHSSGIPWTRTLTIVFPPDPTFDPSMPSVTVNADPSGSYRLRSRNSLDIRVEKGFKIGNFGRLGVFIDVINALGEHWFDVNQDPGGFIYPDGSFERWPTYGQFTAAHGLRIYKVSARFTF